MNYDEFRPDLERYHFDFGECCPTETDFCQIDTPSDFRSFGIWANPADLRITKFVESEVYRNEYETEEAFCEDLRETLEFHSRGKESAHIDPHGNLDEWLALGFESYIYESALV